VAGVQSVFDEEGRCLDEAVEQMVRRVGTNLVEYIRGSVCPQVALEEMMRRGPTLNWTPPQSGQAVARQ
ncbi:MAG: hypothetical protein O6909_09525, partial [Alphaproteobacteria bacterium]|nr:hypothetical protein [Alphaproteobacteria bacterium]